MAGRTLSMTLLLAAAATACSSGNQPAPPPATQGASPAAASSPLTGLPGIDARALDEEKRRALAQLLEKYPSPCDKPHSLLTSLRSDPRCRRAVFAGRYLVRLLDAGLPREDLEEQYEKRFVAPEKGQCDLTQAPMRGNPSAPVTLCEFFDYQCPHCKLMDPMLSRLVAELPDQVRVYAKSFPLSKVHPEARDAAAAAAAAGRQGQGKFWQMHARLFADQDHLTPADLERHATDLKLDLKRWKEDLPAAREQVDRDRAEGEKLGLTGTPTLYINGRKYAGPFLYDDLRDWVDEELAR